MAAADTDHFPDTRFKSKRVAGIARIAPAAAAKAAVRPNWTRIHLVYFALAAFDVAAVAGGLALSYYTKAEFEAAADKVEIGDVLADRAALLRDAGIDLAEPANTVFEAGGHAAASKRLELASGKFDALLKTPLSEIEDEGEEPGEDDEADHGHDHAQLFAGESLPAELRQALAKQDAAVLAAKNDAVRSGELAIAAHEAGNVGEAASYLSKSNSAMRLLLHGIAGINEIADSHVDDAIENSQKVFRWTEYLQVMIGAGILLMVAMVSVYAHFLGKLLRRKFDELDHAHSEGQRLNSDLNGKIIELAAAQDEIVRKGKMAQLGQLTATVAHEIRNPLGAMRTANFLAQRKIRNTNAGIEPQLQRIESGISRCDGIITQLLDFSRSTAAHKAPVALDDWLAKTVQEEVESLPVAVSLSLDLGLGTAEVPIDAERMRRAVVNLVHNASEAMVGKDGIKVAAMAAEPNITITTRFTDFGVKLSVADNGPGIPDEVMPRIREPLFTTKNFGTGLGVPAVANIAEQHGGSLDIGSTSGKGAIFTLHLPLDVELAIAV